MRVRGIFHERRMHRPIHLFAVRGVALALALLTSLIVLPRLSPQAQQKTKLPRPRRLDEDVNWKRDPVTGELKAIPAGKLDERSWREMVRRAAQLPLIRTRSRWSRRLFR